MKYLVLFSAGAALIVLGVVFALLLELPVGFRIAGLVAMLLGTVVMGVTIGLQFFDRRKDPTRRL
jgi:xanthosine utilization system XapX-like protein